MHTYLSQLLNLCTRFFRVEMCEMTLQSGFWRSGIVGFTIHEPLNPLLTRHRCLPGYALISEMTNPASRRVFAYDGSNCSEHQSSNQATVTFSHHNLIGEAHVPSNPITQALSAVDIYRFWMQRSHTLVVPRAACGIGNYLM